MKRIFSAVVAAYLGWACVVNVVDGDALWAAISVVGFLASLFNFALESKGY